MGHWPLIGRQVELAYLQEQISDPSRPGVVVAGAAGVGKTRLLQEVVAATQVHHVERVTATRSAQALPFGAMSHLLPESLPLDQADLLGAIGRYVRNRADGRPVLLVVDDSQLLDPLSATFIHHAATTGLATTLLGMRSGEPAPDAITALYRDDVLARLELQPISRSEFEELVRAVLAGDVETATLDRLWEVAAGNVLYMRELLLDAAEAGTLRQEHGLWLWSGRAGNAPRLREMVFSRIGNLSSGQRRMLEVLAIAGPLGLTLLESLASDSSPESAERDGLITTEREGRRVEVRLAHPLFGEALLQSLSALEHRRLHHTLADALDRTGARRREDKLRLAVWRLEAGDECDADLLTAAARLAWNLDDFELAERLARAATQADGGFAATLQLGQALNALTRYDEAETVLRGLIGIEPDVERDHESLAYALVASVGYGQGRTDDALQILVDAEHRVTEPQLRALLQAHRAALLASECPIRGSPDHRRGRAGHHRRPGHPSPMHHLRRGQHGHGRQDRPGSGLQRSSAACRPATPGRDASGAGLRSSPTGSPPCSSPVASTRPWRSSPPSRPCPGPTPRGAPGSAPTADASSSPAASPPPPGDTWPKRSRRTPTEPWTFPRRGASRFMPRRAPCWATPPPRHHR